MMLVAFLFSPPLLHCFRLGRPDHQGLALFFTLLFATLFYTWGKNRREPHSHCRHRLLAGLTGLCMGLSLWVSFFEPFVLSASLFCVGIFLLRKKPPCQTVFWSVFTAVMILSFFIEGWKFYPGKLSGNEYLKNWMGTIGELRSLRFGNLSPYFGWLIWISPLILIHGIRKKEPSRDYVFYFGLVWGLLMILSFWHVRWTGYAAVFYCLSIPVILGAMRGRIWKWVLFLILIFPCMRFLSQESMREPDEESLVVQQSHLRYLTQIIPAHQGLVIMAPWWWSPHILYWTGNPIVASSSHQSIEGVVDSAKFYSALQPEESLAILKKRGVNLVVGYDAPRLLANSLQILGFRDITDLNVVETEGYAFSTASRLMDERREDYLALDGHLFMQAYSSPLDKYQFRIFWVLDNPQN